MNATERRNKIIDLLKQSVNPISAALLAKQLGVSRQVIVGDVALLRAANHSISATPRGYIIERRADAEHLYTVACRHSAESLPDELYAVVDNGGGILDVSVEHAVYGQISGQLHIFSRYDADEFMNKLNSSNAPALSALTGGVHLHTIACPSEAAYRRIKDILSQKGILLEE